MFRRFFYSDSFVLVSAVFASYHSPSVLLAYSSTLGFSALKAGEGTLFKCGLSFVEYVIYISVFLSFYLATSIPQSYLPTFSIQALVPSRPGGLAFSHRAAPSSCPRASGCLTPFGIRTR